MQNYSQTLDLDMLNRRYWHRRMQQCKAEFKARQPQPVNPSSSSPSFSNKLQSSSHKDWSMANGSPQSSTKPILSKAVTPAVIPPLDTHPSHVEPSNPSAPELGYEDDRAANGIVKGRPLSTSSKPSRPIKYQVR